mmetsp:Transcript_121735/g.211293  ORF Transcript_121735/g.211293 Transcript_121735/m.211293 type:complete len:217 (-) Transcript_121735:54-704(-)
MSTKVFAIVIIRQHHHKQGEQRICLKSFSQIGANRTLPLVITTIVRLPPMLRLLYKKMRREADSTLLGIPRKFTGKLLHIPPLRICCIPQAPLDLIFRRSNCRHFSCIVVRLDVTASTMINPRCIKNMTSHVDHAMLSVNTFFLQSCPGANSHVLHNSSDGIAPKRRKHRCSSDNVCLVLRPQLPNQDVLLPSQDFNQLDWHVILWLAKLQARKIW